MFYADRMRVEYREEPCRTALNRVKGMPFELVAQPVHGLRAPLHLLLRPGVRGARRPARRRPLRALDPRQGQRRRGSPRGARASLVEARERRRRRGDRSVPAGRGPVPAHAGLHRRARPRSHAVLADHARAAGQARRRRARGGRRGARRCTSRSRCRRSTSGSGGRRSPAPRLRGAGSRPFASSPTRGSTRVSRSRRSSPGCPTTPSFWPTSCGRRGRRARAASGRTSSTCARAPASTSSRRSRGTGPSSLPEYERLYAGRAYLPSAETEPVRATVRELARDDAGFRDVRRSGPRRSRSSSRSPSEAGRLDRLVESPAGELHGQRGRERRDHGPDRGRPRGRPRGPATGAPPLDAHPRRRRGAGRRDRGRARGAPPARRGRDGPADAADGRHRGDGGDRPARAGHARCSSSPPTASERCSSAGSSRAPAATSSRRRRTRPCSRRSRRSRRARRSSIPR